MNINEYLQKHKKYYDGCNNMLMPRPVIECADGFTMSVQAGIYLYCEPRDDYGPYSAVEVGYPSEIVPELMPHIDGNMYRTEKGDNMTPEWAYRLHMLDMKIMRITRRIGATWLYRLHVAIFKPVMDHPVNAIYPCTPVEVVEAIIEQHGGIVNKEEGELK